jgi:hypothetical protein
MSTIRYISEQISRIHARTVDKENNNTVLNWKEVKPLVVQEVNNVIGMTLVNLNEMDVGVNITSGMLATYSASVLSRNSGAEQEWYTKLPVYPIRLRYNLGIYRVGPGGATARMKKAYIIIPECYWDLLDTLEEADLEGNVGVIPSGDNEIVYSKDPGVTSVRLSLVVCDSNTFGDDDELPITAEMETVVRNNVLTQFQPEVKVEKKVQEQPTTE